MCAHQGDKCAVDQSDEAKVEQVVDAQVGEDRVEKSDHAQADSVLELRHCSSVPEYDVHLLVDKCVSDQLTHDSKKCKKRKTKHYYKKQLHLIDHYKKDDVLLQKFVENEFDESIDSEEEKQKKFDGLLTTATLILNVMLFSAKIVAAVFSGSLVVISSVIDSAMDLTTGVVIFFTTRAIKKRNLFKYPRGRTRLEPLALIVISVIMGSANVQVILQSLENVIARTVNPKVDLPTLIIMISTVVSKFTLMIVCYLYPSSNAKVLAQDHRNDCISNTVAVVCLYLASKYWVYLDPIAASLVSVYIIGTWVQTGFKHVAILSGRTASPDVINRIVKVCMDHRPKVDLIDTVYAYHFGLKYLVEVHVVLDKDMTLKLSHDISEPLQRKIERLPFVERAFVHVDYEIEHKPHYEHKLV